MDKEQWTMGNVEYNTALMPLQCHVPQKVFIRMLHCGPHSTINSFILHV